jgi:hypothetical protein
MPCVMQKLKSNSNAELESHIAWQYHTWCVVVVYRLLTRSAQTLFRFTIETLQPKEAEDQLSNYCTATGREARASLPQTDPS